MHARDLPVLPLPSELLAFARVENARLGVPGSAIGVLHGGAIYAGAVGNTSVLNPLAVEPQTLFQIGSTSKTFTATAVMQLVREGLLDIDKPIRTYLPWFRLASEADAAVLTARHLLTHHAGFVGDYFRDTGRGGDAIGAIVRKLEKSPQIVPAGFAFSYSNAAFFVLGHIVETLRGKPFETVVAERIFAPLAMSMSFYFPEQCMTHRFAVGHIVTSDGPVVAPRWHTPRSIAPGGGITSNVIDQMRYAALHLGVVDAPDVLSQESCAQMQRVAARAGSMCDDIGLSWMLDHAGDGNALVKHGGATNGQLSSFELIPAHGFAVSVLTNADAGRASRQTIADACQQHFLGFGKPEPQAAAGLAIHASDYVGRYAATLVHLDVTQDDAAPHGLRVHESPPPGWPALPGPKAQPLPPAQLRFRAVDETVVLTGARRGERVEFLRDSAGEVAWLRWDGRLAQRVG